MYCAKPQFAFPLLLGPMCIPDNVLFLNVYVLIHRFSFSSRASCFVMLLAFSISMALPHFVLCRKWSCGISLIMHSGICLFFRFKISVYCSEVNVLSDSNNWSSVVEWLLLGTALDELFWANGVVSNKEDDVLCRLRITVPIDWKWSVTWKLLLLTESSTHKL